MIRIGWHRPAKLLLYPIRNAIDAEGRQLVNWVVDIETPEYEKNDWNRPGRLEDFIDVLADWHFEWLDVPEFIRSADVIFEYPMVDQDPLSRWTFGRLTLLGDAAHPMYPRGSNGAAQAAIDARTLADFLRSQSDPRDALKAYEEARLAVTAKVVRTNREHAPDFINIKVEELVGDKPFDDLNHYITQDELRALSENYKRIAGFTLGDMGRRA
jgi:2-polyprenyl-6-methoxyphenol hydroxylase-like FAD-dependent oxidoreductase